MKKGISGFHSLIDNQISIKLFMFHLDSEDAEDSKISSILFYNSNMYCFKSFTPRFLQSSYTDELARQVARVFSVFEATSSAYLKGPTHFSAKLVACFY